METMTLVSLLDADREQVLANIARDRALPAVQAALEKELDRLTYRYAEACDSPALRDSAQIILQSVRNALPLMDSVGEVRTWQKQYEAPGKKRLSIGTGALAALLGGLVLVLASVLGVLIAGRAGGVLAFLKALLPVALGCGLLFWAGLKAGRGREEKLESPNPASVRTEYLADAEKLWHSLRGILMLADAQLQRVQEESAVPPRPDEDRAIPEGELSSAALELFAGLLETAYASSDEGGRESASAIRFYLHNAGVDVVDFGAGRESWFEFLPASRPGTIRPALVSNQKLLKKGMASA